MYIYAMLIKCARFGEESGSGGEEGKVLLNAVLLG